MAAKKRSPLYQWEQEMIAAFYDYQWHLVLDSLYEQFQKWKTGELSHNEDWFPQWEKDHPRPIE